jgi:hypothetical protein
MSNEGPFVFAGTDEDAFGVDDSDGITMPKIGFPESFRGWTLIDNLEIPT